MSETEQERETRVRRRAYELWQQAGEPDGRDQEFWHQAQADLRLAGAGDAGVTDTAGKAGQGLSDPEEAAGAAG